MVEGGLCHAAGNRCARREVDGRTRSHKRPPLPFRTSPPAHPELVLRLPQQPGRASRDWLPPSKLNYLEFLRRNDGRPKESGAASVIAAVA
jgi:hypothetical protein